MKQAPRIGRAIERAVAERAPDPPKEKPGTVRPDVPAAGLADGATVRDLALMIWEGPTAVYGEIWNMGGASPVRLWGGSLPIVSFTTTGLQIVAWSLTKTLAASAAYIVHGMGSAGYTTGLEAA